MHVKSAIYLWAIKCTLALSLFGIALGHWSVDQPYRALLWNQSHFEAVVNCFGISWQDWVTDTDYSAAIDTCAWWFGTLFAGLALCQLIRGRKTFQVWLLTVSLSALAVVGFTRWADHYFDWLWPLEFMLRFSVPLLTICLFKYGLSRPGTLWLRVFLIACGATFVGHGCYSIGFCPTPSDFYFYLDVALPISDPSQQVVLWLIGGIDILCSLLLFWPRLRRPILIWMCIWGGATALMRLSTIDTYFFTETAAPALAACLERLPHCLIPLLCWHWLKTALPDAVSPALKEEHGQVP